ncbi:MAG: class I SAM-dependent DNA methyltransferase [Verrucomicrobiales bacterium]
MDTDDDWYNSPRYYDLIFDEDTENEVDFLEAMMWEYGIADSGKILEPACGSGRLVSEFAKRGYSVDGFDLNENMLEFAQRRLVEDDLMGGLWIDSMQDFKTVGRYDLAHCLVSTFKYLSTEADAVANLERVADSLERGGLYIVGIHLTNYDSEGFQHERWVVERDGLKVTSNTRTWPADRGARTEKLRNRLRIEQQGKAEKTLETTWQFRTYDAAQLRELIERVPAFEAVAFHDFNCEVGIERQLDDEYEDIIVVLRKR